MDIMNFERDELYWSCNDKYWLLGSNLGHIFTGNRFDQIKCYLHFSDDNNAQAGDKLHKVRFILDHLRTSFQSEYYPHKQISVDEAMIPFKGRLGMKQYM